jgi:hypothetical protein
VPLTTAPVCWSVTEDPAMSSVTPVIHDEASEARNSVAAAASPGCPMRRSGNDAASSPRWASVVHVRIRSFSIADGAMQLTRIPCGPTSAARCRVRAITPALAAA